MRIFAVGDLHLPGGQYKPMEVFGEHWRGHWEKIQQDWRQRVGLDDLVLLPGDISWAMQLSDALEDIGQIGRLPGKKLILRGNHDYWWSSISKVRQILPEGMMALQNDTYSFGGSCICGSRGWVCSNGDTSSHDQKIYQREVQRMAMSLSCAKEKVIIVMIHYPPFTEKQEPTGFTDLFEQYGVQQVVYGHLHGKVLRNAFEGELRGVEYIQVSCDHLDFKLRLIRDM